MGAVAQNQNLGSGHGPRKFSKFDFEICALFFWRAAVSAPVTTKNTKIAVKVKVQGQMSQSLISSRIISTLHQFLISSFFQFLLGQRQTEAQTHDTLRHTDGHDYTQYTAPPIRLTCR